MLNPNEHFKYCVNLVFDVKFWMKNIDMANSSNKILFFPRQLTPILPCHITLNLKKKKKQYYSTRDDQNVTHKFLLFSLFFWEVVAEFH